MEPFVICGKCGEKNSPNFSKCRKCKAILPPKSSSSPWEHVLSNNMKRCNFCNARIKVEAKYCSKCGQKQVQETESLPRLQQKIDIEFTKNRVSLEHAIQSFDRIFASQRKQPVMSQDLMFDQKRIWYLNQKERFLQKNISNEMFYSHLKSLKEYLQTTAIIPESREELEPETHSTLKTDKEERCWTCGKNIREGSPYLTFCSKTCEREYSPYETGVETLPSSAPKHEEVITESNYRQELVIVNELKTLQFSPSSGRILYLLSQLKKTQTLSSGTITTVNTFRHHQDDEIRVVVYSLNEKVKKGKIQIHDPPPRISQAHINETSIQKELPIIKPQKTTEITPQEPIEPFDLPLSKSMSEIPDLESSASTIPDIDSSKEIITELSPLKSVSEEKRTLFSSFQYQVQDLIFEEEDEGIVVRLIPFSGSIKEIKVTFNQNQIIMEGCLKKQNLPLVNLELKTEGEPRQPSWEDPWQDIALIGEEKVLKRIKMRSGIAHQFVSLGEAKIKVESQKKGEICLQLTCNETEEAIKIAYSLIKDLQLFLEISFY